VRIEAQHSPSSQHHFLCIRAPATDGSAHSYDSEFA